MCIVSIDCDIIQDQIVHIMESKMDNGYITWDLGNLLKIKVAVTSFASCMSLKDFAPAFLYLLR